MNALFLSVIGKYNLEKTLNPLPPRTMATKHLRTMREYDGAPRRVFGFRQTDLGEQPKKPIGFSAQFTSFHDDFTYFCVSSCLSISTWATAALSRRRRRAEWSSSVVPRSSVETLRVSVDHWLSSLPGRPRNERRVPDGNHRAPNVFGFRSKRANVVRRTAGTVHDSTPRQYRTHWRRVVRARARVDVHSLSLSLHSPINLSHSLCPLPPPPSSPSHSTPGRAPRPMHNARSLVHSGALAGFVHASATLPTVRRLSANARDKRWSIVRLGCFPGIFPVGRHAIWRKLMHIQWKNSVIITIV